VQVEVEVSARCDLEPTVHAALYRISQEALNNVVKHAQAGRVLVEMTCEEEAGGKRRASLRICDDGRGFDPSSVPPESLGLDIMQERAEAIGATLTIETGLACGTAVSLAWLED
jgi:signal transduction histidine kinase